MAICEAQGGFTEPQTAPIQHLVRANQSGVIRDVHNRRLSRLAKLLGAPEAQMAGIDLHANFKDTVALGDPLFTLHAQAWGEMEYAKTYLETHPLFLIEASD